MNDFFLTLINGRSLIVFSLGCNLEANHKIRYSSLIYVFIFWIILCKFGFIGEICNKYPKKNCCLFIFIVFRVDRRPGFANQYQNNVGKHSVKPEKILIF